MRTFIIAEAGVNHNGDIEIAKRLVDAAVQAGADAVKFQTFKTGKLVTAQAKKARYQIKNTRGEETQLKMLKKLELSSQEHKELFHYCRAKNIIFMSTPFDEGCADMLDRLGMQVFKIPSGEITNKPLIRHIAGKGKPIILSTGMSCLGEVEKAVEWIKGEWKSLAKRPQLTLLHCVSNYPAQPADANLSVIDTMKRAFKMPVGYSDHTLGTEVAIAAAALGAKVIEKHITLDRSMEGPDHKASLEPDGFKSMVKAIRNVEKAMGDGIKKPVSSEGDIIIAARRSLVAARGIKRGESILKRDLIIKRPGNGIPPEFKDIVTGMKAMQDISEDTVLKWGYLKDA